MKSVIENTSVNVIYLTTACNFNCSYCYEQLKGKQVKRMTKNNIVEAVDKILKSEPQDQQTLFVMFGGEVFLEWENAKFLMDYAFSKKKNVHFNFETNGFKFIDENFINDFITTEQYKNGVVSLDVSFDGVGNSLRVFKNGKETTSMLLNVFKKLHKFKIPFRIRYTIHDKNINFLQEDLYQIAKYIQPTRIITSVAYNVLNQEQLKILKNKIELIKKDFQNNLINIPICEMCCDFCNQCSNSKQYRNYFSQNGNINRLKYNENASIFKDF